MVFECKYNKDKWLGRIVKLINYGTHYEINIESRSGILVIFGKTTNGNFACMPDFNVGCHLASPSDIFWNTEQLTRTLGKIDGITVANALYAIFDNLIQ